MFVELERAQVVFLLVSRVAKQHDSTLFDIKKSNQNFFMAYLNWTIIFHCGSINLFCSIDFVVAVLGVARPYFLFLS